MASITKSLPYRIAVTADANHFFRYLPADALMVVNQLILYTDRRSWGKEEERVLKQLKSPFKELTRYGVLLRSFDLPLLKSVSPELLPEAEALERFNQLIRYPYIESRGNYRYAFHELVREALAEETQKDDVERRKR